ncbi:MAG: uroporphyrinogen-III C-methyltransferase [Deferribacteraceae bacterium]|jgi:uroporphyrin-III C-methyltransferase|nr:uroporphyrinogen-III C-methyltransferase [Deferribacteraceae bacterium]
MKYGRYIAVGGGQCADLITVRGLNRLQTADLILYDRLADEALLQGVAAEKVLVGKVPYRHSVSQEEINAILVANLQEGKTVVRLKGGDSLLFSRVAEEIAAARTVGAEIEIVPGVTTASTAMAKVESALTDREHASGVIFITGHSKEGLLPAYDWAHIAKSKLTLVIYMGVKNIAAIVQALIDNGLSMDTPILAAESVGSTEERYTVSTVGEFNAVDGFATPSLFVIGRVLNG